MGVCLLRSWKAGFCDTARLSGDAGRAPPPNRRQSAAFDKNKQYFVSAPSGNAAAVATPLPLRLRAWLARLLPGPVGIDGREACSAAGGVTAGLLFAAFFSRVLAPGHHASAWMVAPLGASALLVFGLPASPLAQPWAVLAGNTLSALVGIASASLIPDPVLASGVAVALAMLLMVQMRCLHPPGGAAALMMVLSHQVDFGFALFPVLLDSLLLVLMGVLYNSLTGRPYPHAQVAPSLGVVSPV